MQVVKLRQNMCASKNKAATLPGCRNWILRGDVPPGSGHVVVAGWWVPDSSGDEYLTVRVSRGGGGGACGRKPPLISRPAPEPAPDPGGLDALSPKSPSWRDDWRAPPETTKRSAGPTAGGAAAETTQAKIAWQLLQYQKCSKTLARLGSEWT